MRDTRQSGLDSLLERGAVSKGSQTLNPLDLRRRFTSTSRGGRSRTDRPTATSGSEAAVNLREGGKGEGRACGRVGRWRMQRRREGKRESGEDSTNAADQSANEE